MLFHLPSKKNKWTNIYYRLKTSKLIYFTKVSYALQHLPHLVLFRLKKTEMFHKTESAAASQKKIQHSYSYVYSHVDSSRNKLRFLSR